MHPPPYRKFNRNPLRLLLSADYSEFVTTRVLTTGYRIVIAATALAVIAWSWVGISIAEWAGWGIAGLISLFAALCGLATLAGVRVVFEYIIVIFDIAETLHKTDKKTEYLARIAHQKSKADDHARNEHDHTATR